MLDTDQSRKFFELPSRLVVKYSVVCSLLMPVTDQIRNSYELPSLLLLLIKASSVPCLRWVPIEKGNFLNFPLMVFLTLKYSGFVISF